MSVTIQIKRGTDAQVQAATLGIGELAFATDTKSVYTYDGVVKQLVGRALYDTLANRPTYGVAGRLYMDSATGILYMDTGSAWVTVGGGGSSETTVTAGETLSQYNVVYFKSSDSKAYKAICSGTAEAADVLGIVTESGGIASSSTGDVTLLGTVTNGSWNWTVNKWVYVSSTAGTLTQTAPTTLGHYVTPVGIAVSATSILVHPMTGWAITLDTPASTVDASDVNVGAFAAGQYSFNAVYSTQVAGGSTSSNITLDLAAGNNFYYTLTGSVELSNPSNMAAGQSGLITIVQGSGGSKALTYGGYWKFPTGANKTLSTAEGAVDAVSYYVASSSVILCQLLKGFL